MKLIKINTDHYVIVDDSEIKKGDWVVGGTRTVVQCMYPENVHHRDVKKITHSTHPMQGVFPIPITEVKELLGEVDVERKAELYVWGRVYLTEQEKQQTEIAYMTGYNQAIQDNKDKKYTEENMKVAITQAFLSGLERLEDFERVQEMILDNIKPKTEWEVEFDENGKLKLKQ